MSSICFFVANAKRSPGHRVLGGLFALVLAVGLLPAAEAGAVDTAWKLYDRQQAPAPGFTGGPYRLPCGGYGVFEMRFDGAGSEGAAESPVPALEEGREVPPDYPLLTSSAPSGFVERSLRRGWPFGSRAGEPAPPPCDGGGCFTASGQGPWVAVVDWNNWHGWSVGWTIRQASGGAVEVALYALDDPTLATYFGERITDVHLLAQLCQLSETLEDPDVDPPVAVNLSFGRPPGRDGGPAGSCDPTTLSCQIRQVLEHLRTLSIERVPQRANPTVFFAAAGNHRGLLFPGTDHQTISVGALDLQLFHRRGWATGAWETPEAADALFPAQGLCLEYEAAPGLGSAWPAPPGSSFATALMTGWLAPSLGTRPLPENRGRWAPAKSCWGRRCSFVVARGGRVYGDTTTAAQNLIRGTASDEQTACSSREATGDETLLVRSLGRPRSLAALPALSFPEVSSSLLRPTPEPASCVPCEERFSRGRARSRLTTDLGTTGLGVTAGATRRPRSETLTVQLWAGQALAPDLVLTDLYLRVERWLYPVELDHRDRRRLEDGEIDLLELDLSGELPKRTQPSLIWVLRGVSELGGEVELWTSSPILFRGQ